jgi:hypothetical protein
MHAGKERCRSKKWAVNGVLSREEHKMAFASRRKRPGQGRGREAAATVGGGDEDDEDEELEISNEANESSNA